MAYIAKITRTIKVQKENLWEIKALPCVQYIKTSNNDKDIHIILKTGSTQGNRVVMNGEYLCLFSNGLWQRFGAEAMLRTNKSPSGENW